MDQLEKKHIDTKRGFRYCYYISPASKADSSKPALLLTHGWPDNAHMWRWIVPHLLKTSNRIVVPDLLGYAGTDKPTDPKHYEISLMVQDVLEIFEAEKIQSQIIPMGHDWGSFFAQRFYLINKDRMAGLITLNVAWMPPRGDKFNLQAFNEYTTKVIGYPAYAYWELFADPDGPRTVMDPNLESLYYALHGDKDEWMKQLFCVPGAIRDWISKGRTDVELRPFARDEAFKREFIEERKAGGMTAPGCWYRATAENYNDETDRKLQADPRVDTPYLFIGATGDAVCRIDAIEPSKAAGLFNDLEVQVIESGHWSPFEKPDEVGSITLEWLKKKGFSA